MLIGVDFDNTIVCYDGLVHQAAVDRGLIPPTVPAAKGAIRDYLRAQGQEDGWTALQGYVYGAAIREALPFPGVVEFFARCRERGVGTCIVSHRSRQPFRGATYDLHAAAHDWLADRGFYDAALAGLTSGRVHFEVTRDEKLSRIAALGCQMFIDDLPEFLTEPEFPTGVHRVLFDPAQRHGPTSAYHRVSSWAQIAELVG
jgi:hypothetical protein